MKNRDDKGMNTRRHFLKKASSIAIVSFALPSKGISQFFKQKLTAVIAPHAQIWKSGEYLTAVQQWILQAAPRKNPEQPFNFKNPAGPAFPEEQQQEQREAGKSFVPMVVGAFKSGADYIRIPPGDYRFGQESHEPEGYVYPLELSSLHRDADHTFTIDATGVTCWFDLTNDQADAYHSCVGFINCSNIIFRGATIDRGTLGNIEGCITQIDAPNNRIEIQLSPGFTVPAKFNGSYQQRILPFKADGTFCGPLYVMQQGGVHLQYKGIVPGTADGCYWVEMRDTVLLDTIRDPDWIKAYGSQGVLRVGDGLLCIYTTTIALMLKGCKNMTMQDINIYVPRGWGRETGGYGANLWKNCYLGPRPGSSRWNGGENFMFDATRHGTTLDNVTVLHATDDPANFHGYWGNVRGATGNRVTFGAYDGWRCFLDDTLPDVTVGDSILFYNRDTGKPLGHALVAALDTDAVILDRPANLFINSIAEFPEHECGGWTIQNCNWHDNYQRILIASGPGIIRNCTFTSNGSFVQLNADLSYVEGGVPQNITIADNVFTDVNPQPGGAVIDVKMTAAGKPTKFKLINNITIAGNTFNHPGEAAILLDGVANCVILNNHINDPIRYTALASPGQPHRHQAIILTECANINAEGNNVSDPGNYTAPDPITGSNTLGLDEKCKGITLNGKPVTMNTSFPR